MIEFLCLILFTIFKFQRSEELHSDLTVINKSGRPINIYFVDESESSEKSLTKHNNIPITDQFSFDLKAYNGNEFIVKFSVDGDSTSVSSYFTKGPRDEFGIYYLWIQLFCN